MEKFASVWDVVDKEHQAESERLAGSRAITIVTHRIEKQFGKFLRTAHTNEEKASRLFLIEDNIDDLITAACKEFDSPIDPVKAAAAQFISSFKCACSSCGCEDGKCGEGKDCGCTDCGQCGNKTSAGHKPDCQCGFCLNKGSFGKSDEEEGESEEPEEEKVAKQRRPENNDAEYADVSCPECGSKSVANQTEHNGGHSVKCNSCGNRFFFDREDEKVSRTADQKLPGWNENQKSKQEAVFGEDGGQYQMDDVKTIDSKDGWGDQGAVKTDRSRVPEDGLKPVSIPSKEHPHEDQSVEQRWNREYTGPYNDEGPADTSEKPHEFVDADNPIGNTTAYETSVFPAASNAASPVTSNRHKWHTL